MTLYHGTDAKFRTPDLSKCFSYTDFGKGFYLTHELERAKEWGANHNSIRFHVNVYDVPDDYVRIAERDGLRVKVFETATPEWAEFVYCNRHVPGFVHDYDIVIGPVADNGLQEKFAKMKRRGLSFADIASEIRYSKFKKPQICFCTQESINLLNYVRRNDYTN